MKVVKAMFVAGILSIFLIPFLGAKPEYAKKEGKKCDYCHVKLGSKELNDTGKYYKEHNHSFEGYKEKAKEPGKK